MDTVSVNELLLSIDKRIKKITTGSELLFMYELDKYARLLLGVRITLKDVQILKKLHKSEQFSFIVENGVDVGFALEEEDAVSFSGNSRLYFTGTVEGVVFKSQTPELWTYDFSKNIHANSVLHGANRSAAYVSLLAYMLVSSKVQGVKCPKLLIDHVNHAQLELEYVDLLILKNYGNKLLQDLVDIKFSKSVTQQPEWEAFVMVNRQRGQMCREYTPVEKFRYLKKNFQVGDVVLYYRRTKGAIGKTINKLLSCYPAVITGFDEGGISFTYYPTVETRLTRRIILSGIENERERVEYTSDDYNRFTKCRTQEDYTDIGIGAMTFTETLFLLKVLDTDGSYQYFKTEEGYENVWLSTADTIYAIFADRGIEYNKTRFLGQYFKPKNRVPVFDTYLAKLG